MNSKRNKWWGGKHLLFFCSLIVVLGMSFVFSSYLQNTVKAEGTTIDDSPLGEKIVDVESNGYTDTKIALTEDGYVYAWGSKSDDGKLGDGNEIGRSDSITPKPVMVRNGDTLAPLKNIKKIIASGFGKSVGMNQNGEYIYYGANDFGLALDSNGDVYGWGDNRTHALGLSNQVYTEATKLNIDFKVKDIDCSDSSSFLVSREGELYVAGTTLNYEFGLGVTDNIGNERLIVPNFTKVESDVNDDPIPNIKSVVASMAGMAFIVTENGLVYGCGQPGFTGTDSSTQTGKFKKISFSDGYSGVIKQVYPISAGSYSAFLRTDLDDLYINVGFNGNPARKVTLFHPYQEINVNGVNKIKDPNNYLLNASFIYAGERITSISPEGVAHISDQAPGNITIENAIITSMIPYEEGNITTDYRNAKKLVYNRGDAGSILLSNAGSVFVKGKKVEIGELSVSGLKNDNTEYTSDSKYNDQITVKLDDTTIILDHINVKVKDLITNTETTSKMSDASITVNAKDERVYQEYTFYYDGQENQGETFVVDLYQHIPETSDLTNNGTYKTGKTISFSDNVLPNNTVSATLSKNNGTPTAFTSGTAINDEGSYSLVLKDLYGNTNTYAFKISNAESAESISFTKSSAGELIVGNTITKVGNVVGTISLNYPAGVTGSTIDSMTIDQTGDGANFEVYGKDGLKVITKDLEAREYVVNISGTDANGLAFSGTIKFTVAKIPLSLEIQLQNKTQGYQSSVTYQLGDTKPLERIQVVGSATVDLSTLGKPVFSYEKDGKPVVSPMNEKGTYTVSASYPPGTADHYNITWTNATLIVEDLIIDESNISDFVKLESGGKSYTQNTWTDNDIIITPIHPVFSLMDIDYAGNQSSDPFDYSVEGEHTVTLSFYTSEGAEASTDVILNYDHTPPTITNFVYEDETTLRSIMRAITFDHYFGKAQQLSFTGSDEIGGSGLDHFKYEIVELDQDKNEKPASKKTGTLKDKEKISLNINTSYRISAWAVDQAGNESGEKIERVYLSNQTAQLNITATSDGKSYDGSKWVSKPINIILSGTSTAGVQKYQYSKDGITYEDLSSNTITLPDPLQELNDVPYTFRAINLDGTESDSVLAMKIDPVKPIITVKGSVDGTPYDGSEVDQSIVISPNQTNKNNSGITYYYTTSASSKDSDPLTDQNWKKYNSPITHSTNGTYTYYFKGISGAGVISDSSQITVKVKKKEYIELQVNVTTEGKDYSPGNWAKHDITFTLSGGMKDPSHITGYEYTTTSGAKPNVSADWKPVNEHTLMLEETVIDRTYWFRVLPIDPDQKISQGIPIKLDVDEPSVPVLTMKYENTNALAQLINTLSFGEWMNKQAVITMKSTDQTSGIDHYEYEERSKTNAVTMKSKDGVLRYGDETEVMIRARACDKAGNCSEFGDSQEVKVDMKAPSILGVKNQSIYVQYYLPKFVSVTDDLSGIAQATYTKAGESAVDIKGETKIEGEGIYQVYAKDEAGNEVTLQFKIVRLPYIETEIDGSDESREIIDQVIDELEEGRSKLEPDEIKDIEQWIKEAEEKWESSRRKVVETEDKAAKVEGQGDTTFDPNTELIVEEISKDKVPVLPRNAIKTYDVYLRKGKDIVLPDGSVKVYLPYTEDEPPIVYEINEDGTFKELIAVKEGDYVTFITNTLKKYAISNEKQKENKPEPTPDPTPNPDDGKNDQVCVAGPDGKLGTSDDVCGEGNGTKDPDKESDGSVTVPDGGSVIFPDGNEVELPDGGIIKPDGSVELPDGSTIDKDGNKKPKVCEIKDGIILNKDSDGDGLPDLNLDIDNDCSPDLNIDFDNDGIPDFNIDSTGDGKADVNVDHDNDGFVDQNAIKLNQWIPNLNSKVNGFAYDTMSTDDIKANSDEVKTPPTNDNQNGSTNNTSNGTDTKGNGTYHNNAFVGGAGTGDTTKWTIWGILVALTLCTLGFTLYKKHKQKA